MAEPLILAYGRGELPEFPASADAVIDIVPCDYVVNAILAVCATEPTPGEPEFYHVSSGARNPLTFHDIYGHIRSYFTAHPLENVSKPGAPLPEWKFPGAVSVERLLSTSERAHGLAERVVSRAPRSQQTRKLARDLDQMRGRLDFWRKYHTLYNEYAQSELHFVDDNTLALTRSLDPADVARSPSTPRATTGRPTSRTCTAPRSRPPYAGWTPCARSAANRPTTFKDLSTNTAGAVGGRGLRPRRHDHVDQRHRAVPVGAAARALAGRPGRRAGRRPRAPARLPADRAAGPRQLPAGGLPPLPGPRPRRARAARRHDDDRLHPRPGLARRDPAHRGAPGGRAHDDPHHRRRLGADPAAARPLRRDPRRRARGRRRRARRPATWPRRRWWGSRARPGCSTTPRCTGSTCKRSFAYADSHSDLPMLSTRRQPRRRQPGHLPHARRPAQELVDRGVEDQVAHPPLAPAPPDRPPRSARAPAPQRRPRAPLRVAHGSSPTPIARKR